MSHSSRADTGMTYFPDGVWKASSCPAMIAFLKVPRWIPVSSAAPVVEMNPVGSRPAFLLNFIFF